MKCDGGGGALGHPVVFYDMGEENFVECLYCDRRFTLDPRRAGDIKSEQRVRFRRAGSGQGAYIPPNEEEPPCPHAPMTPRPSMLCTAIF